MSKTIVGLFQDRSEAERVAQTLAEAGFGRGDIHVYDQAAEGGTGRREGGGDGSFWSWLFGSDDDDDARFYADGVQRGGTLVAVTTGDERAERARAILERGGADVHEERASGATTGGSAARAGTARPSAGDEAVLPVVEEELKVGKREVSRGGVRVVSRTSERPVEEDVRLREERVRVERRPVDRALSGADADAFTEATIELTETAEEAVVGKQARVVEEVVVSKDVTERTETVRDRVRRTDVDIERVDDDDFRRHWAATGAGSGMTYEQCSSAYGYGCELAREDVDAGREWSDVEGDARAGWERQHPGTWDRFREPVRYAWDRTRGRGRRAA